MTEKAASPTPEALEGEISVATDTPTEPVTETV